MKDLEEQFKHRPEMLAVVGEMRTYEQALRDLEITDDDASEADRGDRLSLVAAAFEVIEAVDTIWLTASVETGLATACRAAIQELSTSALTTRAGHESLIDSARQLAGLPRIGTQADLLRDARARLAQIETASATTHAESVSALETFNESSTTLLGKQQESAKNALSRADEQLQEVLAEARRETAEVVRQQNDDRKAFVDEANAAESEGARILDQLRQKLSIAGDESLSAGYGLAAKAESDLAERMRERAHKYGVATAVAAAAALLLQLFVRAGADYSATFALALLPAKLAAVAALAGVARYAGSQSTVHRNEEQRLRKIQLELENIGEYVSEMPESKRAEVREHLLDRFFGGEHTALTTHDSSTSSAQEALGASLATGILKTVKSES